MYILGYMIKGVWYRLYHIACIICYRHNKTYILLVYLPKFFSYLKSVSTLSWTDVENIIILKIIHYSIFKITWICKAVEVILVKFKHGCDLMIVTLLLTIYKWDDVEKFVTKHSHLSLTFWIRHQHRCDLQSRKPRQILYQFTFREIKHL